MKKNDEARSEKLFSRYTLILYDLLIYAVVCFALLYVYPYEEQAVTGQGKLILIGLGAVSIFGSRVLLKVYRQIVRFSNAASYIRIAAADFAGGVVLLLTRLLFHDTRVILARVIAIVAVNCLLALIIRFMYQYIYRRCTEGTNNRFLSLILKYVGGLVVDEQMQGRLQDNKIRVAIIGAGNVGYTLTTELKTNLASPYRPVCFVDKNPQKAGRSSAGLPVFHNDDKLLDRLQAYRVQEVILAMPGVEGDQKHEIYQFYKKAGYKVKVYDYPTMAENEDGKRHLREFEIVELLQRRSIHFDKTAAKAYYRDKVILITGGGGSIGSELCRQIAKMEPKQLIILDIYENGAYDIQQELKIKYGAKLDLKVEICSVTDKDEISKVFEKYHPQIILHAAAHKHVPLMENNVCEAVRNNVFGTHNVLTIAEKYGAQRFIMISTDKAVNPTNVMGATKRMDEMVVLNHKGRMHTSATRFGNVLGSAGSVIPLFKRQIANGGPVTLTDKRIIRYFMTIPEASRLVLQSGVMAARGELFVLDMGRPVPILQLAENMIRLSGLEPYKDIDIIETGLRPGEKLYEELLINSDTLRRTDNELIFIEQDKALTEEEVNEKMKLLSEALKTNDDEQVRAALHKAVPTFRKPEEVNRTAMESSEMQATLKAKKGA